MQLYLNYKLKSVAHLPWRQMSYKFLNTIIDDLFAFVIKMPTLHRLSVFRDDLVFLVYMYQRWIYRVDRKRANEFGCVACSVLCSHAPAAPRHLAWDWLRSPSVFCTMPLLMRHDCSLRQVKTSVWSSFASGHQDARRMFACSRHNIGLIAAQAASHFFTR